MSAGNPTPQSDRATVKRLPERARYDAETVHAVLDEGRVAHVGLARGGSPVVIPMVYARIGERLYLHGSPASQLLRDLGKGVPVCVTVTLLDGLVLARSAFHHSMNYRSVVVFGTAHPVEDLAEKARVLRALVDQVLPGRSAEVRGANDYELRFTRLLGLDIEDASVKLREGPPRDDAEDLSLPYWAGVVPLPPTPRAPIADPTLEGDPPVPASVRALRPD